MKTLLLGGGGREHALAHALSRSKHISELHCAPGNPGIAQHARLHSVDPCDPQAVLSLCRDLGIELVVIGPEAPLVAGTADVLRQNKILTFGPGKKGAQLESSKVFSKEFMLRHGIATAPFECCTTMEACKKALLSRTAPFVVKADGLAAGKGAFLPETMDEALDICHALLVEKQLGEAGAHLVIEDFVEGKELTILAITDGKTTRILSPSQDHKRALDDDKGPNTGGMGAYSPVDWASPELLRRIEEEILNPTIQGLNQEEIPFCGVIYAGLMITPEGKLSLLEYNVRLGDPEAQVVLPIFNGDWGEVVLACCTGTLGDIPWKNPEKHALGIVLTSGGYPLSFQKGFVIHGLERAIPDTIIYHAGTTLDDQGTVVTDGGRVLAVVGIADTLNEAKTKAYERAALIDFEGCHYRKDIGKGGLSS